MLTLDPAKLLIIGVVALLVLGPDKLPAAARKASSLLRDLQQLRSSLHEQVRQTVGDHPVVTELTGAHAELMRLRKADPRQALYRSIGLYDDPQPGTGGPGTTTLSGGSAATVPPISGPSSVPGPLPTDDPLLSGPLLDRDPLLAPVLSLDPDPLPSDPALN